MLTWVQVVLLALFFVLLPIGFVAIVFLLYKLLSLNREHGGGGGGGHHHRVRSRRRVGHSSSSDAGDGVEADDDRPATDTTMLNCERSDSLPSYNSVMRADKWAE